MIMPKTKYMSFGGTLQNLECRKTEEQMKQLTKEALKGGETKI